MIYTGLAKALHLQLQSNNLSQKLTNNDLEPINQQQNNHRIYKETVNNGNDSRNLGKTYQNETARRDM